MRKKVIAGNWKMNMLPNEAISFIEELAPMVKDSENEVVLCVPYTDSLAHTTWECKYHIVFAPKFRRKEIINAEACPDHIHMYVSIPPKLCISSFMRYLKGKSTLIIFERHANLKYKYGNRAFWCTGYYVSTVGKSWCKVVKRNRFSGSLYQGLIGLYENPRVLPVDCYVLSKFCENRNRKK